MKDIVLGGSTPIKDNNKKSHCPKFGAHRFMISENGDIKQYGVCKCGATRNYDKLLKPFYEKVGEGGR